MVRFCSRDIFSGVACLFGLAPFHFRQWLFSSPMVRRRWFYGWPSPRNGSISFSSLYQFFFMVLWAWKWFKLKLVFCQLFHLPTLIWLEFFPFYSISSSRSWGPFIHWSNRFLAQHLVSMEVSFGVHFPLIWFRFCFRLLFCDRET